ncbi:excinuclease ABC subunit C [Candidatus Marinamargulisbacteria bacterium SCGC AAA071-K20]|nr:excinuclease ABC subunit C [Candidatus Marinamargulisbacteria bacterium SCGC AAA071-K20]
MMSSLKHIISTLSDHPGIYKMMDHCKKVIYVGKAKNLKKRVQSYFSKTHHDLKTELLVSLIAHIETIVTNTESEALILERELIRTYKPRFNILLKDDKSYPYVKVTNDIFPRVLITREKKSDNAHYFGPFPTIGSSKYLEKTLLKIFPLRSCKQHISLTKREPKCILLDIGKCIGPCINKTIKEDYQLLVQELLLFLRGKDTELIKSLKNKMKSHSDVLEYEKAGQVRDRLIKLEVLTEKQLVSLEKNIDYVLVAIQYTSELVYVLVQDIIGGKLLYQQGYFHKRLTLEADNYFIELSLLSWFSDKPNKKHNIICDQNIADILKEPSQKLDLTLKIETPQKGDKKSLLEGAKKNARLALSRLNLTSDLKVGVSLEDVKETLALKYLPESIFGFDISHLQGNDIVASSVCFKNGKPSKKDYRQYHIKTVSGKSNDPKSMKEVVKRRLERILKENTELPNLLLIDGGKAQLNYAMQAIKECQLEEKVDCLSIAKRFEDIYHPMFDRPKRLLSENPVLQLLQKVRDESHRFAVTFQRKKRQKQYESVFLRIKGLGSKRLALLYKHFKTLNDIRSADINDLCEKVGVSLEIAEEIKKGIE